MKALPYETRMEVLNLYLQGLSGDKVCEKTGVSKGAVVSIIKDAREGKYPELELKGRIDELHNVAVRLRKQKLDLVQASLGFSFFERLLNMGVEPERLEEWITFCSEISTTAPGDFIPAAMELLRLEKETGLSYSELAEQVKELEEKRQNLIDAVGELEAEEKRARKLEAEIERNEKRASELRAEKDALEREVNLLRSLIEKKAVALGVDIGELEAKLKELVNLDNEVANRRSEYNRLQGEVEALNERHEKLSSRIKKASADFERDIKLIKKMRQELVQIAEIKGRYEAEVKDMEWAKKIVPFLIYPDRVDDPDFKLASVVVNCIDKWLPEQKLGLSLTIKWRDIVKYVHSKGAQPR